MKKKDNVIHADSALYGKWLDTLTALEYNIYFTGLIGMNISKEVCLDNEDVECIGGLKRLREVLDSIDKKAENLKGLKFYFDANRATSRIRNKFLK